MLTGTTYSLLAGTPGTEYNYPLVASPFSGVITGSLTFDSLGLVSDSLTLTDSQGDQFDLGVSDDSLSLCGPLYYCSTYHPSYLDLTESNGIVTGATGLLETVPYHDSDTVATFDSLGDGFSYSWAGFNGPCEDATTTYTDGYPNGAEYAGPTIANCQVSAGGPEGTWKVTQAPELDVSSAAGGFSLLFGCLAILRDRRRSSYLPEGN